MNQVERFVPFAAEQSASALPKGGVSEALQETYAQHYARKGADRDDIIRNGGVLFSYLAWEASIFKALRLVDVDRDRARLLDVGCGWGASVALAVRAGFRAPNVWGIDGQPKLLERARETFAGINFCASDASNLPYDDEVFDLVMESTMFVLIVDDGMRLKIAAEMSRVLKPGGCVIVADWRYSDPRRPREYKGLPQRQIRKMFPGFRRIGLIPGSLIPPLGRALSKHAAPLYFVLQTLVRPLVGQVTTVLQKPGNRVPAG